jgi:hypothetical protein
MKKLFALCVIVVSTGIAACEKSSNAVPNGTPDANPAAVPADHPRDVRPPPASSGMSSDPNNPNGAPGPSSGLGISPNRY